jgi:translation initiation factor 3 subunit D
LRDRGVQIGLAARVTPKDPHSHVLLATSQQKPKDFAAQLNIKMGNCWAIVRHIVDLCLKLGKDKYVLMKDPNKPLMYLYEMPSNAVGDDYEDDAQQGTPMPGE